MKHIFRSLLVAVTFVFGTAGFSEASLIPISSPDLAYTSSTTLIPILSPNGTDITSITDGTLTISFSDIREVHTVPSGGWATWSAPPNSETSTPRVLGANGYNPAATTVTLTFSQALGVFGLEAEPDPFAIHNITATFFNGAATVGTITRAVNGNAGARLFAASADGGDVFTSVRISSTADFALAQLRYDLAEVAAPVPEPTTMALLGTGLLFLIHRHRRSGRKS